MSARAAIYARVSTEHQAEFGTSLGTQIERCRQRAEVEGWTVVGEFVERGVSGAATSRPQLDQMLDMVQTGYVTVIITTALDRIGRSATHLVNLFDDLDAAGVRFVSLRESIDSSNPYGRVLRHILVGLAELERELIRERMGHGRFASARNGTWVSGSLPWGLALNGVGDIVVDEEALVVIERIVDLLVDEGLSPWQVAPLLNREGLRTPRGSRWTPDGLRTLFKRTAETDRWAGRITTGIDSELGLPPVDIEVPPVLSADRLTALRTVLAASSQSRHRKPRRADYPLSRRVKMPCGGHLTGIWRRDRATRTYRCSNYPSLPEHPSCGCPTIDCDALESRVWEIIRQQFGEPTINTLTGAYVSSHDTAVTTENSQTLARTIANLETAAGSRAAELLAAGVDTGIISAAIAQIEDDLAATRNRYQHLRALEATQAENRLATDRALAARTTLLERLAQPDSETTSEIVRVLDLQITVTGWRECDDPDCDNGRLRTNRRHNCPTCARRKVIPNLDVVLHLPE